MSYKSTSNLYLFSDPRLDSDISIPYGYVEQIKKHQDGESLDKFITNFGQKNNFWKGMKHQISQLTFITSIS